jgi:DNA-binding NarL/FixJ family response regulator
LQQLSEDSKQWKSGAEKLIVGLADSIDKQLERWGFSKAEKDVALLLLKGLSIKEIASVRSTSEKTVRAQTAAIYSKSGLAGRSELSAFFLEDLLSPPSDRT